MITRQTFSRDLTAIGSEKIHYHIVIYLENNNGEEMKTKILELIKISHCCLSERFAPISPILYLAVGICLNFGQFLYSGIYLASSGIVVSGTPIGGLADRLNKARIVYLTDYMRRGFDYRRLYYVFYSMFRSSLCICDGGVSEYLVGRV